MIFFNSEELAEQVESFGGDSLGEYPEYLGAIVAIRKAAALANARLGYLSDEKSKVLVASCDYILEHLSEHVFNQTMMRFVGKPANRMVDQKIAEIASEVYGVTLTHEGISLNQFTTDVTVTAEGNAVKKAIDTLVQNLNILGSELALKADEFKDAVKCGRLGLKDSLPVRLGDEFASHHKILTLVSS